MNHLSDHQAAEVRREFAAYEVSSISDLWKYYSGDKYFIINNALRYSVITPRLVSIVNKMLTLVSPLPKGVTLYRGLRFKHEFKVGDNFSDAAFMSTTFDKLLAWGPNRDILELSIAKSTPFVFLNSELEVVLPPRCNFTVDEVIIDYDGRGHNYILLHFSSINDTLLIATVPELPNGDSIEDDIDYLDALDIAYNLCQYLFDVTA